MVGRRSWHYQIDDLPPEKWFAQQQTKLYKPGKKGSNQRIIFWFTKWHFMLVFQHSGLQKKLGKNAIVLSRRWSRYNLWCWSTASWGYGRRYYISIAPIICTGILWLKYLESISIVSELRGVKIWNFDTSHHTWRPSKNPKKNLVLVAECVTWGLKMVKFVGGLICCIFN